MLFFNIETSLPLIKDLPRAAAAELSAAVESVDPAEHVISHRGASGDAPEHSFEAYDLAIRQGSRYLELDVVVSRNGTIYISHDFSALRLTGVNAEFQFMTDKEIDALRTRDGCPILRLESVFERYGKSVNYVIELKRPVETADKLTRLLKKYDLGKNAMVQCARIDVIKTIKKSVPDLRFIVSVHDDESLKTMLKQSCVDIILVEASLMSAKYCLAAHECGKQFAVWTLNDQDQIIRAITLDVDFYYTNYPAQALELEARYRGRIRTGLTEKHQ